MSINLKLPEQLDKILNDKCISHAQVIQAITDSILKFKTLYGEPPEEIRWFIKAVPGRLMELLLAEHVKFAEGEELEAIGKRYGVTRGEQEIDQALRERIIGASRK